MADARSFVPVVEALSHPGPALILDRRGRSHSGEPGDDYTVETEVADLLAWIDSLDADVQLADWSYGATIALEAAARDARIRGVVGYEPVLPPFGAELIPAVPGRRPRSARRDHQHRPVEGPARPGRSPSYDTGVAGPAPPGPTDGGRTRSTQRVRTRPGVGGRLGPTHRWRSQPGC
ncbi:alpha/beta fold hydrolase [Microlunatus sp. Y2014]|uniref:alpha/beta fold hydrolase n=1 Tax=Microlunatus sp. Y2014 TaxID=3418488 RepID=UPI003DA74964